ncbi:hypothetical protein ACJX0J_011140, partial [Zea mays]
ILRIIEISEIVIEDTTCPLDYFLIERYWKEHKAMWYGTIVNVEYNGGREVAKKFKSSLHVVYFYVRTLKKISSLQYYTKPFFVSIGADFIYLFFNQKCQIKKNEESNSYVLSMLLRVIITRRRRKNTRLLETIANRLNCTCTYCQILFKR